MQNICANQWCKQPFEVTDEDLAFYDKVSPVFGGRKFAIPPPTRCPECRLARRICHLNEMKLYRRPSAHSKKEIISIFSPDKPYQPYAPREWWGDDWDPMTHGMSVVPDADPLDAMDTLMKTVPCQALYVDSNENSEYVNYCGWDKNCHLCYCVDYSQDCIYCHSCYYMEDCLDCLNMLSCRRCYQCVSCKDCYQMLFSQDCTNCSDSAFLLDCLNCKHCFGCAGLRQKEYCFFNKQLTRSEYEKRLQERALSSYQRVQEVADQVAVIAIGHPRRYYNGQNNEHVSGNFLSNCCNALVCFDSTDLEDCKFCHSMRGAKDCQDVSHWGHPGELCYECLGVGEGFLQSAFCSCCWKGCANLYLCFSCISCQDCFLCVGLRKKQYCILNKQYTKQEYERIVPTLIDRMIEKGQWGEFLPPSMSPFGYNESVAQDYFPLTENTALERGFHWSDYEPSPPKADRLIKAENLPDAIEEVPNDILNWAVECEATKRPFKIIKQELEFYRAMKLPIPRIHPDERHRRRMLLRNPRKLWNRACAKCNKTIETSYSPERPETVLCEECYLKEVY